MTIHCTVADYDHLDDLTDLAEQFYALVHAKAAVDFRWHDMRRTFKTFLQTPGVVIFVVTVDNKVKGFIAATISRYIYNNSKQFAQELMWWVDPAYRDCGLGGLLLSELEIQARAAQCEELIMVDIADYLHDYYLNQGYTKVETSYTKRLTP